MADLGVIIRAENLEKVAAAVAQIGSAKLQVALANALNDVGFQAKRAMEQELRSVFDRPTPFITRSVKVFAATPAKLSVAIAPTLDSRNAPSTGGAVGVDPQDVLQAQEAGGRRRDKRSESVLRRAGILPAGFQTAIPATPYPGSVDAYGNISRSFVVQLLSYLQAFGEHGQGYKANMLQKNRRRLEKGTAKKAGRRYFVSLGRYRDATRHLAPGIWAASGPGGVDVRPVLMFVKTPNYKPRLSMQAVIDRSNLQDYLDRRVRYRVRNLAEGKLA